MPNIGATELALILALLLLLFGAKRLPETARGVGRSLRILRAEAHSDDDDAPASREV